MKHIIINGANGYVASNFITNLLKLNYKVIALVRPANKSLADERMREALSEISDGEHVDTTNLRTYSYSLLDENFSIPDQQLQNIFSGEVDYFHFAASLKFDLKSKKDIFETNVAGLEKSIEVYSKYAEKNSRFFFIGTAYSCGIFSGLFEEKFYENKDISHFRNYYEQSKRLAENVLKTHIEDNGLNAHIIRLSQVVGNNKSGVTKTEYGIFDFVKRVYNLSNMYPNKIVRVKIAPNSTQNLIPIDTVVCYLIKTVETSNVPVIMNFTGKKGIKNVEIINGICRLLPIHLVPQKFINHKETDVLERLLAVSMSYTGSYIDTNLQFDTKKRDAILWETNEVNEQTVYKMLQYFIHNLSEKRRKKVISRVE